MPLSKIPSEGTTGLGRRNLIINGAMNVAQRGTSSSSFNFQTVDRFRFADSATDELAITQAQVADAPDGFVNSYKITVDTAETSMTGNELLYMRYTNEAQDCQHLEYGSSSAKTLTLSFWVKSSITGDYAVLNFVEDSGRARTLTYTINSANTWEYKTIVFTGDTTTGKTINNDNDKGLDFYFTLACGPDRITTDAATAWVDYDTTAFAYGQTANVAGTTNATWQVTGVQLEVGTVATDFEHRSFGEELALCQRYYYQWLNATTSDGHGLHVIGMYQGTRGFWGLSPPVAMRASPSITKVGTVTLRTPSLSGNGTVNSWSVYTYDKESNRLSIDTAVTGGTANVYRNITFANLTGGYKLEAEL